ncbi:MAG: cob(I)yrinic acid a,c-diamide adenosyltransferase [Verrucomicrobiales bacterium]|nr:cob(I)yrinic acid a,c-diamide adenosyltransferase [Verrucomicrobiales bacterium]
MSIVTRTGDAGGTSLLFGRRVAKDHPRVEACGTVDELSAALGLVRCLTVGTALGDHLARIQQQLITLMGELATTAEDLDRLGGAGFARVDNGMIAWLEECITAVEGDLPPPAGWLLPGEDEISARLHLARTVCRRAERRVAAVQGQGERPEPGPLIYLNRLADLLWLLARQAELTANP